MRPAVAGPLETKAMVVELVTTERWCRDTWQWERMHECYHEDSHVVVSWFDGTGRQFVDASREMVEAGLRSIHLLGPSSVDVLGTRAVVDTGCTINVRRRVDAVDVDIVSFARLRSKVEQDDAGAWRMRSLQAVFQKDMLQPVVAGETPPIDRTKLASYRPSYRFLAYSDALSGYDVSNDLPGFDRPDSAQKLFEEERDWLNGAEER